jgi:hypothetical protein
MKQVNGMWLHNGRWVDQKELERLRRVSAMGPDPEARSALSRAEKRSGLQPSLPPGKWSDKQFWFVISLLDWPKAKKMKKKEFIRYELGKRRVLDKLLSEKQWEQFDRTFGSKFRLLSSAAIRAYRRAHKASKAKTLDTISKDFEYLTLIVTDIIGMGESTYRDALRTAKRSWHDLEDFSSGAGAGFAYLAGQDLNPEKVKRIFHKAVK